LAIVLEKNKKIGKEPEIIELTLAIPFQKATVVTPV
jgi:hypothetical protein